MLIEESLASCGQGKENLRVVSGIKELVYFVNNNEKMVDSDFSIKQRRVFLATAQRVRKWLDMYSKDLNA